MKDEDYKIKVNIFGSNNKKKEPPKLDISIEKDNIKRSLSCLTKNINSILDKIDKL
jgi:hypothetical protein